MSTPLNAEEMRELASMVKKGESRWKWIGEMRRPALWMEGGAVVRTESAGDHTPEEITRAIYETLKRRRDLRRAERTRRRELKVQRVVRRYFESGVFKPGHKCELCGRKLHDRESIERGIGPECWQKVLCGIAAAQEKKPG